jgi:integrase
VNFSEKFLTDYADKKLKAHTSHNYRSRLKQIYPAIGHIKLRDLRTGHLNSLYARLQKHCVNYEDRYTAKVDFLSEIANRNMNKHKAPYLDEEDAGRLLTLLHNEPIKYRTMIARSAFVLLQQYRHWQEEQHEACGDYWKQTDDRIFTAEDGGTIHPDTLSKWFKKFVKQNNFPDVHLHSLRHTYASLMIADGIPLVVVSNNLGHAQVSTTADIYSHVIKSAAAKAADSIDSKFSGIVESTSLVKESEVFYSHLSAS